MRCLTWRRYVFFCALILLSSLFSPTWLFAADPAQLKSQIDTLVEALGDAAAARDPGVQKSLLGLLKKIDGATCNDKAGPNASCKIDQLVTLAPGVIAAFKSDGVEMSDEQMTALHAKLDMILATVPPKDDLGLTLSLALATAIVSSSKTVVTPDVVLKSVDALITALQGDLAAAKPELSKEAINNAAASVVSISNNLGVILKAVGANNDVIHVVGAWYGDLAVIREKLRNGGPLDAANSRYCSATHAVRARCERKAQCFEPVEPSSGNSTGSAVDGATSEIDGTHLCGYEPAPFAEPRRKGLVIRYDCVSPNDRIWMRPTPLDERIGGAGQAVLRNSVLADIRCQPPPPKGATNGSNEGDKKVKEASADTTGTKLTATDAVAKALAQASHEKVKGATQ